jgi:stage II sporulation protein D
MKLVALLLPFALVLPCAARPGDGGGGDVTVAMFSSHSVHSVTVASAASGAWIARCARCKQLPLSTAVHFASGDDVFAGGTVTITDDLTGDRRTASGLWHLHKSRHDEGVDVVLTVPSERYVAYVLNAEASASEPPQSLRAMAITVRTYALQGWHYPPAAGHLPARLCDSTECQAMRLGSPTPAIENAVEDTAGEALWFGPGRAEAYFSQSCGGVTEDAGAVWPALRGTPYLRSHADAYCIRHGTAAWHAEVPLVKLKQIAKAEGWKLPADVAAARVVDRSVSHRALRVDFSGEGTVSSVSASALRFAIGRSLGWNVVRSDLYDLAIRNGLLVFDGRGHGHGVGLCQAGATEMATEGKTAREILVYYFPGTAVRVDPRDDGWKEAIAGPLRVRSTSKLDGRDLDQLEQTWAKAQQRFAPRRAVQPSVVLSPTTEIFRQLTNQPGWMLASTAGEKIVLQPLAVFRGNRDGLSATLMHEMLHVLVETECNGRTPLWLREGLVEALAEEPGGPEVVMTPSATDDGLARPVSRSEAEQAHRAAAARVRALISRYGLSAVRSWLSAGVPGGVA